jgi:hypothetical protein
VHAGLRRVTKNAHLLRPGRRIRSKFYRHRYPSLSLAQVREKLARFEGLLGEGPPVEVTPIREGIFRVSAAEGGAR